MDHSISFNQARKCYILKYKENSQWKQKWLPTSIKYGKELEVKSFVDNFFSGVTGNELKTSKPLKSVRMLSDLWLKLRKADVATKPKTYKSFENSLKNHILINRIADLDIETQLMVSDVRDWAMKLQLSYSSRLSAIRCLKTLISDSINEGWLSEELVNVCTKEPIRKLLKEFSKQKDNNSVVTHLNYNQVETILTQINGKVKDNRRIKYLLAICSGLRHSEIQALTFSDLKKKEGIWYLDINKQLYKKGSLPAKRYEELVAAGLSKDEIAKSSCAIIANPKLDSVRMVPVHPLLLAALKYWKETGWKNYVGKSPDDGSPMFPRSNESLKELSRPGEYAEAHDDAELFKLDLKRLGLSEEFEDTGVTFDFHCLRHTFSTLLDSVGVEAEKIGLLLGHKTKTVTRKNYIGKNLSTFDKIVSILPVPKNIQLRMVLVESATT